MEKQHKIGATYLGNNKTEFWVFAPYAQSMTLHILSPQEQTIPLTPRYRGYHQGIAENVAPGALYKFCFNGHEFPDPASRFQPQGVLGPSQIVDNRFAWTDQKWRGLRLPEYIIYECHVGTLTPTGTFKAIIALLDELCELGITALELMPIAQFSGERNWGYDGVFPFAPQNNYGTPQELRELIDACHQRGLAVILDVVYNHLGPEGNVLTQYGPYFTDKYKTPWGSAINFDGLYSDAIRYFFLENALMWLQDYHIDALRLDALHTIFDESAYHFAAELSDHVHRFGKQHQRHIYLIAESALNDTKLLNKPANGGYSLDGQWNDDFHHALHALITGEKHGYYQDFGKLTHLVKAYREGFVLTGQYSQFWQRRHGASALHIPTDKFVVFAQNHDHIGNRVMGERLTQLISFAQLKLTAGLILLSPFIPLLFMGEEYGETAPFLYFTSHRNPELVNAIWKGRKEELKTFFGNDQTPNPQSETSFLQSQLNRSLCAKNPHNALYRFYQELIALRKSHPALSNLTKENYRVESSPKHQLLFLHRRHDHHELIIIFNFLNCENSALNPLPPGTWCKILDSGAKQWDGDGELSAEQIHVNKPLELWLSPHSVSIFSKNREQ